MAKIIVTVGPASIKSSVLKDLLQAGAESFRINLSHSDRQSLKSYFEAIQSEGIIPAVDTQGAQLRVEDLPNHPIFKKGETIKLYFEEPQSIDKNSANFICFNHPEAASQIEVGDIFKIDFDGLLVKAQSQLSEYCWKAEVIAEGKVVMNRAVDIQGKVLDLSPLTQFDEYALEYAQQNQCREVYASFVSCAQDVLKIRSHLRPGVKLISKIESARGVANALEIINASDAILIDRGDLSREISIPSIPMAVRSIVQMALKHKCPVYVATNILDSMMSSNLPSRAEISDIYTLLDSGVSGLVLAAEVAIGKNPISSTSLIDYLFRLYNAHAQGLYGIADVPKPDRKLIGTQLYNWL